MIGGLDSSIQAPSAAQALAAGAAGTRLWSGYIATRSGVNLEATWTQAAFDNARLAGATPIGFCSGLDDPAGIRELAAAFNVRPCLDVEDGIRGDGPWVPDWLDISGAGLYGLASVHGGRRSAFHIIADYPGFDPRATWPSWVPRPPGPVGWQWQGTHDEFGCSVDRGWYDDWFLTGQTPITGGNDMAAAPRPDGSAVDYFVVKTDGTVDHYVWTFAGGMGAPENLGGGLLPHTLSSFWVGVELVVIGQAPQGTFWANVFNSTWSGWVSQGISGGLPPAGPPGPPGTAGPPGPSTYVRHSHQSMTDTGTPA